MEKRSCRQLTLISEKQFRKRKRMCMCSLFYSINERRKRVSKRYIYNKNAPFPKRRQTKRLTRFPATGNAGMRQAAKNRDSQPQKRKTYAAAKNGENTSNKSLGDDAAWLKAAL